MSTPRKTLPFMDFPTVEEALDRFLGVLPSIELPVENMPVTDALGRVITEDVKAPHPVPAYDKAAMDGYAVKSIDVKKASPTTPARLKVIGEAYANDTVVRSIDSREAMAVATGAPLPSGADAVVTIEDTRRGGDGYVNVFTSVDVGKNIIAIGDDIHQWETVIWRGTSLRPQHLGVLASLGIDKVKVYSKPKLAIASTGDELVEVGTPLGIGRNVDINRILLSTLTIQLGCQPIDLGIAPDDASAIREVLKRGLQVGDAVVVSAGSSVGQRDIMPKVINSLGKPGLIVHGVAIRPAYPTGLGVVNGKPILSLPGYPLSALLAFHLFAEPLVAKMLHTQLEPPVKVKAHLTKSVTSKPGFRTYARVAVRKTNGGYEAKPVSTSGAGILSSLTRANAWLIIGEDKTGYETGEEVIVNLYGPLLTK